MRALLLVLVLAGCGSEQPDPLPLPMSRGSQGTGAAGAPGAPPVPDHPSCSTLLAGSIPACPQVTVYPGNVWHLSGSIACPAQPGCAWGCVVQNADDTITSQGWDCKLDGIVCVMSAAKCD